MNTALLEETVNLMSNSAPIGERVLKGLQVLALGMGTVFSVLILLWFILYIFRVIFYDIPNKKKASPENNAPVQTVPEPVTAEEPIDTVDNDEELIAAITAAIAVYTDKPQSSFRVVSFRRTASK